MNHEMKDCLVFLVVIMGRNQKKALLSALREAGMHLINIVYGSGTVKANYLQSTFGLIPEEKKVVVTCIATCDQADGVLNMLVEKFHFSQPNTGIAYTTPVDKISY